MSCYRYAHALLGSRTSHCAMVYTEFRKAIEQDVFLAAVYLDLLNISLGPYANTLISLCGYIIISSNFT